MFRGLKSFWKDESGVAMVLVAIMLTAIIGLAVLAIDMSRANSLHNDLQKGADALALAMAAELDGKADSIERAERALSSALVLNNYLHASSSSGPVTLSSSGVTWRFLRSIPPYDYLDIRALDVITDKVTDAPNAAFVEVAVKPVGFSAIFPISFNTGNSSDNSFNIGASAVAGFSQSICETVPIFMCNPFETTTPGTSKSIQQAFASGDTYSREFRILKVDSSPGPGNFGLVDNNLVSLRDAIATGTAGTCYRRDALTTKTGVTLGQVNAGINVRFDIYSSSLKKQDRAWDYRPASNVRKGASKTSNCGKYDVASDGSAYPLPPGTGYDSTKGMTAPIGSQSFWSTYWAANHKNATYPNVTPTSHPLGLTNVPASRYDVYKYEIANNLVGDKSKGPSNEVGTPSCFKGATPTSSPDRRLLNMAIVNCIADAGKINGHTQLKPDGYASVFINTPIQKQDNSKDDEDSSAGEKPISLEIVDVDGPLGNGTLDKVLRNEAQLYR